MKASKRGLESRTSLSARMHSALHQYFGYSSFRPLQEEIIRDVLDRKDVFVLMPTGGGKSICYQLPALLMEGVTVVVSPLISLMKDQVDGLDANGIAAACMNSTQNAREIRDVKTAFLENRLKVLYVAPERLMMPGTFAFLKKGKVSLFAIDEAHCISEWGHDFRPEYRKMKHLRNPETGFPTVPIIALTATATERVRKDIVSQLGLAIPPEKGPYVASFNRKNLYYEVRPKKETFSEISDYLKRHRGEAGIVYCQSRNNVESLTKKLNLAGFKALPYHAGLSDMERSRNQELFIKDDVDIIVATIAFGMGIDKSNVRFVIHYDLPRNLESYYQETGRGGRDSGPCECLLFFSRGDRFKIEYFISQKTNEKEKDISLVQLRQMVSYCESNKCRRQTLMEYFGEEIPGYCGNCDSCLRPKGTFDGTEAAIKLINCVLELNQRFGTNYVIDVLTGSKNKKIKQNHHEKLKSHGSGREFTKEQWKSLASELINTGFLDVSGAQYPVLKMNAISRKLLKGTERIELVCPAGFAPEAEEIPGSSIAFDSQDEKAESYIQVSTEEFSTEDISPDSFSTEANSTKMFSTEEFSTEKSSPKKASVVADVLKSPKVRKAIKSGKEHDPILFERLKALRKEIALKKNLPPYIIFSDTTLKEMATKLPHSPEEFHSITGVGDHKLRKYGDIFLTEIEHYCRDYDLISTGKTESSDNAGKESENERIIPKLLGQKAENPQTEADVFRVKIPIPESDKKDSSGVKINNLEVCKLPPKRARYLDMSIQDWSETASSADNSDKAGSIEAGSIKVDSTELFSESKITGLLKKNLLEVNSLDKGSIEPESLEKESSESTFLETDSLKRTYSLFTQGLGVSEIAEIQSLSTGTVFRQFEQLLLAGKVRDIGGLLTPKRQKQVKDALETLETELESIIKAKIDENCQEEELKFIRALLLSRIFFSNP